MREFLLFMFGWSIRSSLVVLVALVVCSVCHGISAAAKNMLWRLALAAILAIPMGMLLMDQVGLTVSSPVPTLMSVVRPTYVNDVSDSVNRNPAHVVSRMSPSDVTVVHQVNEGEFIPFDLWTRITILYLVVAAAIVGRWLLSLVLVRRLSRAGSPFPSASHVRVVSGNLLRVPATFGWRKPVILIPKEVSEKSPERLNAILLHESAHLKRADWLWQLLATFTTALQWANPLIWILSAHLKWSAEEAADNDVLNAGVPASIYASELLSFADVNVGNFGAAIGLSPKSRMRSRLDHVLDPKRSRSLVGVRTTAFAACGFIALGLALSSVEANPLHKNYGLVKDLLPAAAGSNDREEFRSGAKPRIYYVGHGESSLPPTWGMDGSMQQSGLPAMMGQSYTSMPTPGMRSVAVAFAIPHLKKVMDEDGMILPRVVAKLGGVLAGQSGSTFYAGDPLPIVRGRTRSNQPNYKGDWTFEGEAGFVVPIGWTTADLELGMGVGKYRPVAEWIDGKGDFPVRLKDQSGRSVTRRRHRVGLNGRMIEEITEENDPQSMIQISLPESAMMHSWRLRVYDANGKHIRSQMSAEIPDYLKPGYCSSIGTADAVPSSIHRLVLEEREYQWVRVRNIPLVPNQDIKP